MRKAIEQELYKVLDRITFSTDNSDRYKAVFAKMSDKEFNQFFKDIKDGKRKLALFIPHLGKSKMDVPTIMKVAGEYGLDYFGYISQEVDGIKVRSDQRVMVLKTPLKRVAQTVDAKTSVSEGSRLDSMTGQVTGDSKSASISAVELSVLADIGLERVATELAVVAGGDLGSYNYVTASTLMMGKCSLFTAMDYRTGVGSRQAVAMLLAGKHIGINL